MMRLLRWKNEDQFSLTRHLFENDVPPYAIFSHRWDDEEVTFTDVQQGRGQSKAGYAKIRFCGQRAQQDKISHFWMDTCCIDKANHSELSEAITSMFRWYQNAAKCYVLLSDVSAHQDVDNDGAPPMHTSSFQNSSWFKRGWTLQELLAPTVVEFFSREGYFLGTKATLAKQIYNATTIPLNALQGTPVSQFSIAERMRWAAERKTTRVEDRAYCLLGIFDVFMPLIYGEGDNALRRLQREIENRDKVDPATSSSGSDETHPSKPFSHQSLSNVSAPRETKGFTRKRFNGPQNTLLYQALDDLNFRLLTLDPGKIGDSITGRISEYSLTNPPSYYAVSYVWGQEPPIYQTDINNQMKLIRPNLFQALQRLRLDGQYLVWVDDLCINQNDPLERNAQVNQMSTIYNNASGVFIWLGEEDSTSKLALHFISEITSEKFRWSDLWWEEGGFIALNQFLERAWFRRAWVIQEAAFSKYSTILCGDRQVYMDHFITAIRTIRDRLSTMPFSSSQVLANFQDSPAVRLIDTMTGALRNSIKENLLHRRMPLETLVDLSTYSETSDQRDTIYSLLNLASDVALPLRPHSPNALTADYTKPVLDVFAGFVAHCCSRSGKLDIICRPWAPMPSALIPTVERKAGVDRSVQTHPSWISSREKLPFGNPSWRLRRRLHGDSLVGRSRMRCYHTHYGSRPHISVGRTENGFCDGSLRVKGLVLGEIAERSARMSDGMISKECISILRAASHEPQSEMDELPDTIWRTLCADRDEKGERAPFSYQEAMLHLLELSSKEHEPKSLLDLLDEMSSIDPEELLEMELPEHVEQFLTVIRDITWNRRTFRIKRNMHIVETMVGLIPQHAKVGDQICILYGCSVPVVLRKLPTSTDKSDWQLIGEAYVHGIMDGEIMSSSSFKALQSTKVEFTIW